MGNQEIFLLNPKLLIPTWIPVGYLWVKWSQTPYIGLEGLFETQTSSLRTMPWAPRADDIIIVIY
jgi:hypothetical protein